MKKLLILTMAAVMALAVAGVVFAAPPDFQLTNVGSEGPVTYSHSFHLKQKVDGKQVTCKNCHMKLFHMKKGADKITMSDIKAGKFCGACHNGKIAFGVSAKTCNKCHKK